VPVATTVDETPSVERTRTAAGLSRAATSLIAPVATNETVVPVSTVATRRTTSASSIVLSAGTVTAAGASAVVALDAAAAAPTFTDSVMSAALAGSAENTPKPSTATDAIATLRINFIILL